MADENTYLKVKLRSSIGGSLVSFNVTPDIVENRNINYKTMDPLHMPGGIHVYSTTSSRTYNINNVKLISRTSEEATKTLWILNTLRHWTLPYFGKSTLTEQNRQLREQEEGLNTNAQGGIYGREFLGAPPDVLYLSAYAENNKRGNIHKVPVVLTNLSIPYPSDVDYIPTQLGSEVGSKYRFVEAGVPVPTLLTIDINCTETHSPKEYADFNLFAYKNGRLPGF